MPATPITVDSNISSASWLTSEIGEKRRFSISDESSLTACAAGGGIVSYRLGYTHTSKGLPLYCQYVDQRGKNLRGSGDGREKPHLFCMLWLLTNEHSDFSGVESAAFPLIYINLPGATKTMVAGIKPISRGVYAALIHPGKRFVITSYYRMAS
ncbi:hypothetical protein [Kosakonia sp. MUSA4]|uniref:hypothetical protein n=1 Tax=Kosakonia sp. MUSA4 TaxID=2067958 RepID=UPI001ABF8226|nr:hypothetical protein [Kosakonia sp. MUSA4]